MRQCFLSVFGITGLLLSFLGAASTSFASSNTPYDTSPWIEDLEQMRIAFATKYPDLEWEVFQHDLDIGALFASTRNAVLAAQDSADAKKALSDLTHRFGDRHVALRWPVAKRPDVAEQTGVSCPSLGYSRSMQAWPLATLLRGFGGLETLQSPRFPAGIVTLSEHRIGVIKIPLFSPRAFPELCEKAIEELRIDPSTACDSECADHIQLWGEVQMTLELANVIGAVKAAGADTMLIDVSDNGGGSEWAEAAARMLTAIRLNSTPMYFMKGEHWARRLTRKEAEVRRAALKAKGADREFLRRLADLVATRRKEAAIDCDGAPLWEGRRLSCVWLGNGFYSTGLLQSGGEAELRSKPWGALVFTPLKYPYKEGIWNGRLIVVVDGGTGSAAEQFAAELQDNGAAIIIGSPTVGAGCGHTDGGTPTTLRNSEAILEIPDCMRIRPNGQNLASGVQPDVLVGLRNDDSPRRRAELLGEKLKLALETTRRPN